MKWNQKKNFIKYNEWLIRPGILLMGQVKNEWKKKSINFFLNEWKTQEEIIKSKKKKILKTKKNEKKLDVEKNI